MFYLHKFHRLINFVDTKCKCLSFQWNSIDTKLKNPSDTVPSNYRL